MARIETTAALEALYGQPGEASLFKEIDYISDDYLAIIEAAPFLVLATAGPEGLDTSPRGDPAGFVRVAQDRRALLIPDRRGNNRLDSLRNILRDPRVALLFMVPGMGETLRINGRAEILDDAALLEAFEMQGKRPATVLRVAVERVYFQCQKALARSRLWDPETRIARAALPSTGRILQNLKADFDGKRYDAAYPERMKQTIY